VRAQLLRYMIGLVTVVVVAACGALPWQGPEASPTSFTTSGPPSEGRLAVYRVTPPPDASNVSYWSNEGWMAGQLWVRFETTPTGLADFLVSMKLSLEDFERGLDPIEESDKDDVGWATELPPPGDYRGYQTPGASSPGGHEPSYRVLIDESDPGSPVVYVTALIV
jgi:hypothetical protein